MNVLFVSIVDLSGRSGQNIYAREVAAALERDPSVNLFLVCPQPSNAGLSELGINAKAIYYLPGKRSRKIGWHFRAQIRLFWVIKRLTTEEPLDAIVASLKPSLLASPILARKYGIPYILLVEGLGMKSLERIGVPWLMRVAAERIFQLNVRAATQTYAAYEEARQWISSLQSPGQSEAQLLYSAVDSGLFRPFPAELARKQSNLPFSESDFVVGFIGSFKAYHNLDALVYAITGLAETMRNIKLLLVGEGPQYRRLRELVSKIGMDKRVVFTGMVSHREVPKFIAACDVTYAVISSNHGGNPMKCYESLACGRPVIVRNTPDLAFVGREHFGIVVESDSQKDISMAIMQLHDTTRETRTRMGVAAREYILQRHTWDQFADSILKCVR